jgi:hypothetical protein
MKDFFANVKKIGDNIRSNLDKAKAEGKPFRAPPSFSGGGPSLTLDQINDAVRDPMGTWFSGHVGAYIQALQKFYMATVVVTVKEKLFLTSDRRRLKGGGLYNANVPARAHSVIQI